MRTSPRVVDGHVAILDTIDRLMWSELTMAPGVVAPADPAQGHAIVGAALMDGAIVTAAVRDTTVVGLAVTDRAGGDLLALGVAPEHRRAGVARDLLAVERARPDGSAASVEVSMAERDVVSPMDRSLRAAVARRLLEGAGFQPTSPDAALEAIDPQALSFERPGSRPRHRP
jgi:ribosomal protein S18 acetylase RimI-like enzyme